MRGLCVTVALFVMPVLWPVSVAGAQSPANASGAAIDECEVYSSRLLEAPIRICRGTVWPELSEKLVMPLMAATREKFMGKTVLDIGTGSGILALYAAQLGAAKIVATDIAAEAIACTQENARRLGLLSGIETRLVSLADPSAFSVIRPEEVFDVIVSSPPSFLNRAPSVVNGVLNDGIGPNDSVKLGLSIVRGLAKHLSEDGAAILMVRCVVLHTIIVGYARHLGYVVENHPALQVTPPDWSVLYGTFAAQVAITDHIAPEALLPDDYAAFVSGAAAPGDDFPGDPRGARLRGPTSPGDPGGPRFRAPGGPFVPEFAKVDLSAEPGVVFPRLWESDLNQILPGMIVIRKRSPQDGRPAIPAQHRGDAR